MSPHAHYDGTCKYKVWEAVRASTSAPGYFEEYLLDGNVFQVSRKTTFHSSTLLSDASFARTVVWSPTIPRALPCTNVNYCGPTKISSVWCPWAMADRHRTCHSYRNRWAVRRIASARETGMEQESIACFSEAETIIFGGQCDEYGNHSCLSAWPVATEYLFPSESVHERWFRPGWASARTAGTDVTRHADLCSTERIQISQTCAAIVAASISLATTIGQNQTITSNLHLIFISSIKNDAYKNKSVQIRSSAWKSDRKCLQTGIISATRSIDGHAVEIHSGHQHTRQEK